MKIQNLLNKPEDMLKIENLLNNTNSSHILFDVSTMIKNHHPIPLPKGESRIKTKKEDKNIIYKSNSQKMDKYIYTQKVNLRFGTYKHSICKKCDGNFIKINETVCRHYIMRCSCGEVLHSTCHYCWKNKLPPEEVKLYISGTNLKNHIKLNH